VILLVVWFFCNVIGDFVGSFCMVLIEFNYRSFFVGLIVFHLGILFVWFYPRECGR
jgi:hypothetical protein